MPKDLKYLALGDSYTIGESVSPLQSFPFQFVSLLRSAKLHCDDPVIIAKTGWTTDELSEAIHSTKPSADFSIVTLLIGVNNQYRGRSVEEYKKEFENLLLQAIHFASGNKEHVFVLSIPDYSYTPFAANMDKKKIHDQIDEFNVVNKAIAFNIGVKYVDITPVSRTTDLSFFANDGLHPSPKQYAEWSKLLFQEWLKG